MSNNFLRKITDYYRYGVMRNLDGAQALIPYCSDEVHNAKYISNNDTFLLLHVTTCVFVFFFYFLLVFSVF
jgi:hypothetical protein